MVKGSVTLEPASLPELIMRAEAIDCLVSKNSGGAAGEAKLAAARQLGLDVIMVSRPPPSGAQPFERLQDVLDWIVRHAQSA